MPANTAASGGRRQRVRSWVRRKLRPFQTLQKNNEGSAADLKAPPPAADETLCDTTGRRKRNPKSTPERLAYAKAGNPNHAVAAGAAAQAAKRIDEPTPTSDG
jgi:hypothetical protein